MLGSDIVILSKSQAKAVRDLLPRSDREFYASISQEAADGLAALDEAGQKEESL